MFPSSRKMQPTSTPLSIFDNACANFSRCAAVWFYKPPSSSQPIVSSSQLQSSLSQTLNSYPQWCGRLSYTAPDAAPRHTNGFQRIWLTYNTATDIGIPFISASSPKLLSDYLANTATRTSSMKIWDAHQLPLGELLPTTKLAISVDDPEAPNMIIQVTKFACGSTAIGIETTHCLADAVSLCQFANDWARTSRALLHGDELPVLTPVFNPQLLDACAAGDIDAAVPDIEIQTRARALPQHRYDWYKSPTGEFKLPAGLSASTDLSPSIPIPWDQWDTSAPVSCRVFHYSASEILSIYKNSLTWPSNIPDSVFLSSSTQSQISKHDALLAHIWSRINIARQLDPGTTVYLDMTFGLRPRVSPPLPPSFLGSPISHAAISSTIAQSPSCSGRLSDEERYVGDEGSLSNRIPTSQSQHTAELAQSIRSTLKMFDAEAIAAILHDKAYEPSPTRLWAACLGREHVLLTTWVHARAYDVDFTGSTEDGEPWYVQALMPDCDGLVEVMEGPGDQKEGGKWWSDGVDVSVYLEEGAMERLCVDGGLFGL